MTLDRRRSVPKHRRWLRRLRKRLANREHMRRATANDISYMLCCVPASTCRSRRAPADAWCTRRVAALQPLRQAPLVAAQARPERRRGRDHRHRRRRHVVAGDPRRRARRPRGRGRPVRATRRRRGRRRRARRRRGRRLRPSRPPARRAVRTRRSLPALVAPEESISQRGQRRRHRGGAPSSAVLPAVTIRRPASSSGAGCAHPKSPSRRPTFCPARSPDRAGRSRCTHAG